MTDWISRFREIHGNRYEYIVDQKIMARSPIRVVCPKHGRFEQLPMNHAKGKGCPRCARQDRRLSTDNWIAKARAVHGSKYDYSKTVYVRNNQPLRIRCSKHGEFEQIPTNHLSGRGCPECARDRLRLSKDDRSQRIEQFHHIHGHRYIYDEGSFIGMNRKMRIHCPDHGWFEQTPANHLSGRGCRVCGGTKKKTLDEFITNARRIHGEKYDYTLVDYRRGKTPVRIICPIHGEFEQTPSNHVNLKRGCWLCAGSSPSNASEFIKKAITVHGLQYNYSSVSYVRSGDKVIINCPKHGEFSQTPENHLSGNGCSRCSGGKSKAETEIYEFVKQFYPSAISRDRSRIKPYEIDILIPELDLAIEYCGLHWHGRLTRNYHLDKHRRCAETGLRLITIFEDEWRFHQDKVKATLRHFCKHTPKGVYARQCDIREVEAKTAKLFLDRHHLLGSGSTHSWYVGAFHENQLVAVMTFRPPNRERGGSDQIEMTRFVTDGRNHPGLGSRMFRWAIRKYGFTRVVAFVDRRWFTGSFKSIAGFRVIGETLPSLWWTKNGRRFHRRFMTKRGAIKQGILEPGETKLAMMCRLGYARIWDCGKLKLEWTISPEAGEASSE